MLTLVSIFISRAKCDPTACGTDNSLQCELVTGVYTISGVGEFNSYPETPPIDVQSISFNCDGAGELRVTGDVFSTPTIPIGTISIRSSDGGKVVFDNNVLANLDLQGDPCTINIYEDSLRLEYKTFGTTTSQLYNLVLYYTTVEIPDVSEFPDVISSVQLQPEDSQDTYIPDRAFAGKTKLTKLEIPDPSNPLTGPLYTVGEEAFADCSISEFKFINCVLGKNCYKNCPITMLVIYPGFCVFPEEGVGVSYVPQLMMNLTQSITEPMKGKYPAATQLQIVVRSLTGTDLELCEDALSCLTDFQYLTLQFMRNAKIARIFGKCNSLVICTIITEMTMAPSAKVTFNDRLFLEAKMLKANFEPLTDKDGTSEQKVYPNFCSALHHLFLKSDRGNLHQYLPDGKNDCFCLKISDRDFSFKIPLRYYTV